MMSPSSSVTVSAPGKVHLIGEHVVVYGRPALLTAIDKRVQVTGVIEGTSLALFPDDHADYIRHIVDTFFHRYPMKTVPGINIRYHSDIPSGAGLGSSAAIAVATMGMLLWLFRKVWNPSVAQELAYEAEKFAHGNPSGADVTVVANGGLVWFRKEFDFLKSIWSLPISQYTLPSFLLIDSGYPEESTKDMVSWVAKQGCPIGESQESLARRLVLSLRMGNTQDMMDVIRASQRNLETLGVVGDHAITIIKKVESIGGVAKITGAGGRKKGSGMILCYHDDIGQLRNLASTRGWNTMNIQTGEEGIRKESVKESVS